MPENSMQPASKPKMTQQQVLQILSHFDLKDYSTKIIGFRGYYKQTMGNPVQNDYGIYDDGSFVVSPDSFSSYNFNTDPSVLKKGVAVLKSNGKLNADGTVTVYNVNPYLYKIGMHNMKKPYEALRQYGRVTVLRDGKEYTDTADAPFYIDIHKGGVNTTSSLGCQTVVLSQWPSFLALVKDQIKRYKQSIIPYILIEM